MNVGYYFVISPLYNEYVMSFFIKKKSKAQNKDMFSIVIAKFVMICLVDNNLYTLKTIPFKVCDIFIFHMVSHLFLFRCCSTLHKLHRKMIMTEYDKVIVRANI